MPTFQAYNPKIGAWVKYEFTSKGVRFKNIKQKNPKVPFEGIPKKGNKK